MNYAISSEIMKRKTKEDKTLDKASTFGLSRYLMEQFFMNHEVLNDQFN